MVVMISGGFGVLCSMMIGTDFGSGRVGLVGLVVSVATGACDVWFEATRASPPISTSTGFALITFFLMIFTTFSPSCCSPPSVDRSDDDFVTVRRIIFFTILFTFTGGGEVANEAGSSLVVGCDEVPFSVTPLVMAGFAGVISGCVSDFDSITTVAATGTPFVIGFGLSIGFALLIAGSSGWVGSSDFTSLLFSSSVFTFFS